MHPMTSVHMRYFNRLPYYLKADKLVEERLAANT